MDQTVVEQPALPAQDDYYLDFGGTETGGEQFDIQFDGSYVVGEGDGDDDADVGADCSESAAHINDEAGRPVDTEISYDDDEAQAETMEPTELGRDLDTEDVAVDGTTHVEMDFGAGANMEHEEKDEIGYEDDEEQVLEMTETVPGDDYTAEAAEAQEDADGALVDTVMGSLQAVVDDDSKLGERDGSDLQGSPHAANGFEGDNNAVTMSSLDSLQDGHVLHDDFVPDQEDTMSSTGLESDAGGSNTGWHDDLPEMEVVWQSEPYALLGMSEDADEDSYFLSDPDVLEGPLVQFLSSLREIVSEEISPQDELFIEIDQLALSFGERSRSVFLQRSFRQIIDCFKNRVAESDACQRGTLTLRMTVFRDSEERFVELLKGCGQHADEPARSPVMTNSEDMDEDIEDASGDGTVTFLDVFDPNLSQSTEGGKDPEDGDEAGGNNNAAEMQFPEPEEPEEPFGTAAGPQADAHATRPDAEVSHADTHEMILNEHDVGEIAAEDGEGGIDFGQSNVNGHEQALDYQTLDDPSMSGDAAEQSSREAGPLVSADVADLFDMDANGVLEATGDGSEMNLNDDHLSHALDVTPNHAASHESDMGVDTLDHATARGQDTHGGIDPAPDAPREDSNKPITKVIPSEPTQSTAVHEAPPNGTSTTSPTHGDEIDYEDHVGNALLSRRSLKQDEEEALSGAETDWTNGYDDLTEQMPAGTPSSLSGKRNRQTDDVESLADPSDNKRRRT